MLCDHWHSSHHLSATRGRTFARMLGAHPCDLLGLPRGALLKHTHRVGLWACFCTRTHEKVLNYNSGIVLFSPHTKWITLTKSWLRVINCWRRALRSNSVLCCTHFPIGRVLMKVDKYHKVSNLTLKWCKMSFYFILFQCEIWNMTSVDVNNKWVCTSQHRNFLSVKKSNSTPFWLNIMEIQEWTKNCPLKKCTDPYIWNMSSLDFIGC